jgi:hypothetical protein
MKEIEAPATTFNQPREWLLWTVATASGWLLGAVLNIVLSVILSLMGMGETLNVDPAEMSQPMVLLLMGLSLGLLLTMGLSIGALQWLALRRHLAGLQRWAIFTGVGFAAGTFAFLAFMGLGVGLMQWLLLRRDLNKTGWWPVMSAVAWPVAYLFGSGLGLTVGQALGSPLVANLLGAALTGAIIGAITGAVLLWMLRENATLLEGLRQEREAEQAKR